MLILTEILILTLMPISKPIIIVATLNVPVTMQNALYASSYLKDRCYYSPHLRLG